MAKASTKAKNKYAAKAYDRITLLVPKGSKETIKHAAVATMNGSVNGYVNQRLTNGCKKTAFR